MALYASENLVALDIYIRDPYVRLYMRREKITIISFIGNIGGLLGLFMGFSFISMVEVLYIFLCGSVTTSTQKSRWADLSGIIGGRKGREFDMKHFGGGIKKSVMPYS